MTCTVKLFHSEVKTDMPKYCFNYESGQYEWIEKNGYNWDRNEFSILWDDSEYKREEEEENRRNYEDDKKRRRSRFFDDDDDDD